jgi:hypothetical protein
MMADDKFPGWHGTTILAVRRGGKVVVAGDGQVSLGNTVIKGSARKVRRLSPGGHDVVCGFAGSTADAFSWKARPGNWHAPVWNWRKIGAWTNTCAILRLC